MNKPENSGYEDFTLIGFSELAVGDIIEVPGPEITNAVKKFWRQKLFSDTKILATKVEGNKIWLEIKLSERPRISSILYTGMKKSEQQELGSKIGLMVDLQITPHSMDRAKTIIKKYFDDKGYIRDLTPSLTITDFFNIQISMGADFFHGGVNNPLLEVVEHPIFFFA